MSSISEKSLEVVAGTEEEAIKLSVNKDIRSLQYATVFTDCGYTRDAEGVARFLELQNQLLHVKQCRALRVQGSCGLGLAWVACGRSDVYVERDGPLIWDFSGGQLLITEAGGVVYDPSGKEFDLTKRSVLAAPNEELAREITSCVLASDSIVNKRFSKD